MIPDTTVRERRPTRALDRAGMAWACLCAMHCLVLPLAFVAMPALTTALYSFHARHHATAIAVLRLISWEPRFIAASAVVVGLAMAHGFYWHRRWQPAAVATLGLASLATAYLLRYSFGGLAHLGGVILGGALVVAAHAMNLHRLSRRSPD